MADTILAMVACVVYGSTEIVTVLERWAAWAVKRKKFPRWDYGDIVSEGWLILNSFMEDYDPERGSLYTWSDRVLSNRLPRIYKEQTTMRVWKAGDGLDAVGRSRRASSEYVVPIPIEIFFDENIEDRNTRSE